MMCTTNTIRLPEFFLGCQRIRYLYLKDKQNAVIPRNGDLLFGKMGKCSENEKINGIPLFLASDVLAGISQMAKNHPRIHNRYSKQGLATKLKMSDHRIDDIYNGHQVWFYNIEGLFQTVFEYKSRAVKKECLLNFRGLWLERYEDDPLPSESHVKDISYYDPKPVSCDIDPVTGNTDPVTSYHDPVTSDIEPKNYDPVPSDIDSVDQNDCDFFLVPDTTCIIAKEDATQVARAPDESDRLQPILDYNDTITPAHATCTSDVPMLGALDSQTAHHQITNSCGESMRYSSDTGKTMASLFSDQTAPSPVMDYCGDSMKNSPHSIPEQSKVKFQYHANLEKAISTEHDIQKLLENLLQEISEKLDSDEDLNCLPSSDIERLTQLKTILLFAQHEVLRDHYSAQTSFPACILKSYTDILCNGLDGSNLTMFENCFGIEPHRNVVLCILSEWLGKEFNNFEKKVGENVAEFKQNHIRQIGNLPEPQSLVESLFPSCMSCLLENWMGVHRTRYISTYHSNSLDQSNMTDHNYIYPDPESLMPLAEDIQTNCQLQYPFIQIILEFTNNCLISGVAHVLFSRLRSGLL